jgi:hypothetical protein
VSEPNQTIFTTLGEPRRIIEAWQIFKRDAIWLPAIKVSKAVPFLELRAEFR